MQGVWEKTKVKLLAPEGKILTGKDGEGNTLPRGDLAFGSPGPKQESKEECRELLAKEGTD